MKSSYSILIIDRDNLDFFFYNWTRKIIASKVKQGGYLFQVGPAQTYNESQKKNPTRMAHYTVKKFKIENKNPNLIRI